MGNKASRNRDWAGVLTDLMYLYTTPLMFISSILSIRNILKRKIENVLLILSNLVQLVKFMECQATETPSDF
jgi:hypothetical protein